MSDIQFSKHGNTEIKWPFLSFDEDVAGGCIERDESGTPVGLTVEIGGKHFILRLEPTDA